MCTTIIKHLGLRVVAFCACPLVSTSGAPTHHVAMSVPECHLYATTLVPWAAVSSAPRQHCQVARFCGRVARRLVPRAAVGPAPLYHFELTRPSSRHHCIFSPGAAHHPGPFQQLEMTSCGGRRAGLVVAGPGALVNPRAAVRAAPAECLQMSSLSRQSTHVGAPRAIVVVAPTQYAEVAPADGGVERFAIPRTTVGPTPF